MVRQSKPYGPTYQEIAEAIALEHGCGTSAMACFHFICRKIDWETGVMPNQLSLKVIAKRIGDVSYRTAYTAMRQLREAGVITYATRGNNYDGGEANVYCFAIPPLQNLQGVPDTPLQNLQGPPCKNDRVPPAKSTGLNPLPSLSRGENAAASRGEGPGIASGDPHPGPFPEWDRKESYSQYLSKRKAFENGALRAAENE